VANQPAARPLLAQSRRRSDLGSHVGVPGLEAA